MGPRKVCRAQKAPPLGQDMGTSCPEASSWELSPPRAFLLRVPSPSYTIGMPKVRHSSQSWAQRQNSDLQLHEKFSRGSFLLSLITKKTIFKENSVLNTGKQ